MLQKLHVLTLTWLMTIALLLGCNDVSVNATTAQSTHGQNGIFKVERKKISSAGIEVVTTLSYLKEGYTIYPGYIDVEIKMGTARHRERVQLGSEYSPDVETKIMELGRDHERVVVLKTDGTGMHSVPVYKVFYVDKGSHKFKRTDVQGFELLDIDQDGVSEIIFNVFFVPTHYALADTVIIPYITQFQNGVFTNVTDRFPAFMDKKADEFLEKFDNEKKRNYNNPERELFGYMLIQYILNDQHQAWWQFDHLYKKPDDGFEKRDTLEKDINAFIAEYGKYSPTDLY